MALGILGTKEGMTQLFDEENRAVVPVTVIHAAPNVILKQITQDKNGYSAIQVTLGVKDANKLTQPEAGHFAKAGVDAGRKLVELRLDDVSEYTVGQEISADILGQGEKVDVTAVSRGKGFAGAMKRHGFGGAPASHGAHRVHRKPGSVGQCATPSRVFKGKKLPGRMGNDKVTTLNLEIVKSDSEAEILLVKGSVPGARGATVIVRNAVKGA